MFPLLNGLLLQQAKSKPTGDYFLRVFIKYIVFSLFLLSKFIVQLNFRFLLHIDLPRVQLRTEHLFSLRESGKGVNNDLLFNF